MTVVRTRRSPARRLPARACVTVTFDPSNQLTITSSKSSRLAVDIDHAASNSIDTSGSTPKVTVHPYAVMRPAPADASSMRARGLLVIVESASNDYISNTRPLTDQSSAVGAVTVSTDANTYFNVDGTAYTGASGLAAMAALTTNTPVAAYGTLGDMSGITPGFHATAVYAGTSLETLADHVTGVVSARSGNTLTVRGAHLFQRLGAACAAYPDAFYNNATVTIGSATTVSEDGVMATGLTPASISVGQQLDVSGQCSLDSAGNLSLDAATCMVGGTPTPCQARLASSRIWGTLSSATPGSAVLDVLTIGNFAPGGFNFTGTGTPMAAPAAYAVNTGTLDESGVAAAHPLLQVDGIVSPFGAAPPDFHATAIALGSATEQRLVVEWVNGGAPSPFNHEALLGRSEEHTSELQSRVDLVCRLLLEKKKKQSKTKLVPAAAKCGVANVLIFSGVNKTTSEKGTEIRKKSQSEVIETTRMTARFSSEHA